MKRGCRFLISFLLVLLLIPNIAIFADSLKICTFENADIVVILNADGSADIKERWVVNYQQGSFSRLTKNIYLNLPKEEEFTKIDNWDISVDGIKCEYTTNTENRPDYHYGLIEKGDILAYEVYAKSENQVRTYEISYRLYDVVKHVDNEYYLFTFRALPKGYKTNIENFNIYVLPEKQDATLEVLYSTSGEKGSAEFNGYKGVGVEAKNVSDMYKIKVRVDGDYFLSSVQSVSSDDLSNKNNNSTVSQSNSSTNSDNNRYSSLIEYYTKLGRHYGAILLGILAIILNIIGKRPEDSLLFTTLFYVALAALSYLSIVPFFFLCILVYLSITQIKFKRDAKKKFPEIKAKIEKLGRTLKSPAQFVSYFATNFYMAFLVYLIELYNNKVINFSYDYNYIYYPINPRNDFYYDYILKILDDCRIDAEKQGLMVYQKEDNWELPISYLANYFNNPETYSYVQKVISSLMLISSEEFDTHSIMKELKYLKSVMGYIPNTGNIDFATAVVRYYDLFTLINFVRQNKKVENSGNVTKESSNEYMYPMYNQDTYKDSTPIGNNAASLLLTDLAFEGYTSYINFQASQSSHGDSSGHSCSSCSSCSSCGGCGGAD